MTTSAEILFLQQKVDLLETHMNWVISSVTITIGVLMAIFAVIQFVYQRKIEMEEIRKIGENLNNKINEKLLEKELELQTLIKERIGTTEDNLMHRISLINGDIARRFAIDCAEDKLPANAFEWWAAAAAEYSESDSDLRSISIRNARDELQNVKTKFQLDYLLEHTASITEDLGRLRQKHPVEADLLEGLFKKKIESTPIE